MQEKISRLKRRIWLIGLIAGVGSGMIVAAIVGFAIDSIGLVIPAEFAPIALFIIAGGLMGGLTTASAATATVTIIMEN